MTPIPNNFAFGPDQAMLAQIMKMTGLDQEMQRLGGSDGSGGLLGQQMGDFDKTQQHMADMLQQAQGAAEQSRQHYEAARNAPGPHRTPADAIESLFGNIGSAVSRNPAIAEQAVGRQTAARQTALEMRQQQLQGLHDEYLQRAGVAQELGQLDLSLDYQNKANKVGQTIAAMHQTKQSLGEIAGQVGGGLAVGKQAGEFGLQRAGIEQKTALVEQIGRVIDQYGAQGLRSPELESYYNSLNSQLLSKGPAATPPENITWQPTPAGRAQVTYLTQNEWDKHIQTALEDYKKQPDLPTLKAAILGTRANVPYLQWKRQIVALTKPGNPMFGFLTKQGYTLVNQDEFDAARNALYTPQEIAQGEDLWDKAQQSKNTSGPIK